MPKISQLESATDVTANDLIQVVDVEDDGMAPSGTNKKATASLLANQLVPLIDAGTIAGSKIADSGITSAKIADGTIVNADINASASIAGTKVSPNFGSQNIVTTGSLSAGTGSVISGSSSGAALRITQTGSGNAILVEDSENPDSSPFVVNQHGSLQIGFNQFLDITGYNGFEGLQLANSGTSTGGAAITMSRWSADNGSPVMTIGKSRGVGAGNREVVQNGDRLGVINFAGDDGGTGDFLVGANIIAAVDGTPGVGDLPSRLTFATTPDGASAAVEAMRINSAGNVSIGTTSPGARLNIADNSANDALRITQTGAGNALVVEDSANPDSTPFIVDSTGRVVISHNTPLNLNGSGGIPRMQCHAASGTFSDSATANVNWHAGTGVSGIFIAKSRGGSVGTYGAVSNGDPVGEIRFACDDGEKFNVCARIQAETDGEVGIGDTPGRITFATVSDSTNTLSERMRITNSGNVGIGTTSIEQNCLLKLESTTKGFRPPSMTTTERNAISTPIAGLMIYNNTTNKLNFYNGSAWEAVTSSV